MAYKLYINNKLFNGIGNNNYNKGTIVINGTVYQYDNSNSAYVPTVYDYDITDSSLVLPDYMIISSYSRKSGNTSLSTSEYNYTSTDKPIKIASSFSISITAPGNGKLLIIYGIDGTTPTRNIYINDEDVTKTEITDAVYGDVIDAVYAIEIDIVSGATYTITRGGGSGEGELYLLRLVY